MDSESDKDSISPSRTKFLSSVPFFRIVLGKLNLVVSTQKIGVSLSWSMSLGCGPFSQVRPFEVPSFLGQSPGS